MHLNYAYAFVEDLHDFGMDDSNLNFEIGYFVTRTFGVRFLSNLFWNHDGFDWADSADWAEHGGHVHDQAAQARFLHLGGGLGYSLNRHVDLSASYLMTAWGENTHDLQGLVVSTNLSF